MTDQDVAEYSSFREEWIEATEKQCSNSVEKGRHFAHNICIEAMDLADDDEVIYCDGSGDGGIDVAILKRGEADEAGEIGDTWFLVQSKYGSAWTGEKTALEEGWKVIRTLCGYSNKVSSLAESVQEKLHNFLKQATDDDRIILTFATVDPPSNAEKTTLNEIRDLGRHYIGHYFDVECLSVRTVYDRLIDELNKENDYRLKVPLKGALAQGANDLLVGVAPLTDLYEFLRAFRAATQDLDQLYERNVRRFLGGRVKVNKAMQETLKNEPERFGLYNNGITIVVSDFQKEADETFTLYDPYVVNGCQTTRSIWEVLDRRLGSGGTPHYSANGHLIYVTSA